MIRKIKTSLSKIGHLVALIPKSIEHNKRYSAGLKKLTVLPTSDTAVVLHLYYMDNWRYFSKILLRMQRFIKFDLFVTIPKENVDKIQVIKDSFPDVYIVVCPNRGRDVLPFVMLTRLLDAHKYKYVLKFHSKKSSHWDGGDKWLHEVMDTLIPKNQKIADQLVKVLSRKNTGIVGPEGYYYPLTVNFPANGKLISRAIAKIYGKKTERQVAQIDRSKYGFFAGTMFWARIDSLMKVVNYSRVSMFDIEKGQIDATYAHALERLLCLSPEIELRKMYSISAEGVKASLYKTDNIPDWSEDHDK